MDAIQKFIDLGREIDLDGQAIIEGTTDAESVTTVADLQRRVRGFARAIEKSCAPNERVAILLPQGVDAYAAELGALYCGRAFCPLEPSYPTERIAYCLVDLAPKLVITDRVGAERTNKMGVRTVVAEEVEGELAIAPNFGELAYVIYTSGSTGRPKGVSVSRRSMNKFLEWSWGFYAIRPGERWAQFSSLGFDLSLVDLLTCIPSGGTLVPVHGSIDRMLPARFIESRQISIWHSVPSVIPLLFKDFGKASRQLRSLRIASFCGEPLYPQQARAVLDHAPSVKVVNTYGPTEGTFFCSAQVVDLALCARIRGGSLPIGTPIPGWRFEYQPNEDESLDELVISSEYISDGYISDTPDAHRFGVDNSGARTYRTGDQVLRDRGDTFFIKRLDNQVKIRGNRLDLTEIEFFSLEAGVIEAKAFLQNGTIYLAVSLGDIRYQALVAALERALPRHAIPSDILEITPLPRNANEKIDTAALREMVDKKWGVKCQAIMN